MNSRPSSVGRSLPLLPTVSARHQPDYYGRQRRDDAVSEALTMTKRRNILFITADQWRGDCLGANGHPVLKTPNLDKLAADGTLFTQHYTNCVPCSPSRTSLHTGTYQFTHRVVINGTPLDARFTNWALELRRSGRDPVLLGYTDTSLDPQTLPLGDKALTTYESCLPGLRQVSDCNCSNETMEDWAQSLRAHGHPVPAEYSELRVQTATASETSSPGGSPVPLALSMPADLHETAFMVDRTIDYLGSCGQSEWSVHLSLFRPHPPHIAPAPYHAMYDPSTLPAFKRAPTRAAETASHPFVRWAMEWYPAGEEVELRKQQAAYYGLMSEVDHELGRLFAWLQAHGQWDDTLIVFTSDHGEQMGDHWLKSKTGFFEQSYHIPLIIRDPRPSSQLARGSTIRGFTEAVDIAPTLLDWACAPIPAQFDGFSLLPAVASGALAEGWRVEVLWEYVFWHGTFVVTDSDYEQRLGSELGIAPHQRALCVVRSDRYKYVHFAAKLPPLLFDMHRDPDELCNLAADPHHAPTVAMMASRMLTRRLSHPDRAHTEVVITLKGPMSRRMPLPLPGDEGEGGAHIAKARRTTTAHSPATSECEFATGEECVS